CHRDATQAMPRARPRAGGQGLLRDRRSAKLRRVCSPASAQATARPLTRAEDNMQNLASLDGCLDPETLAAYVDGRLAPDELALTDHHIDACQACRGELSALAAVHTEPASQAGPNALHGRLGRFVVMRELGHGAMGAVVRAWDPELTRAVAIKVLHDV